MSTFFDILDMMSKVKIFFSSNNRPDADKFNPPQELSFSGNISDHWKL